MVIVKALKLKSLKVKDCGQKVNSKPLMTESEKAFRKAEKKRLAANSQPTYNERLRQLHSRLVNEPMHFDLPKA